MKKLTFATAMLAAGLTTFAAHASQRGDGLSAADVKPNEHGVRCFLSGCVDADGNAVEKDGTPKPTAGTTKPVDQKKTANAAKNSAAAKEAQGSGYDTIIVKHASANGVPLNLARAVVRIESNFRANARGRAGEVGLMQIKPTTARSMGYGGSVKGLYHPETNIKYGMKYLGMAHKLGGGSVCGTILKYNAGHGARRMNNISAAYCGKVKRYLGTS